MLHIYYRNAKLLIKKVQVYSLSPELLEKLLKVKTIQPSWQLCVLMTIRCTRKPTDEYYLNYKNSTPTYGDFIEYSMNQKNSTDGDFIEYSMNYKISTDGDTNKYSMNYKNSTDGEQYVCHIKQPLKLIDDFLTRKW